MGAIISKTNAADKQPASSNKSPKRWKKRSSAASTAVAPRLEASSSHHAAANTTDMTTLADDSTVSELNTSAAAMSINDSTIAAPNTPQRQPPSADQFIDPRSPFVCRTPIAAAGAGQQFATVTRQLDLTSGDLLGTPVQPHHQQPAMRNALQQKLLRNLGYQACDPRSPTQFINRTPMRAAGELLGQSTASASQPPIVIVNTDNALNESRDTSAVSRSTEHVNNAINESLQAAESPLLDDSAVAEASAVEDSAESAESALTPPKVSSAAVDAEIHDDPRSPSVDIERTPIVLAAEDEAVVDDDEVEHQGLDTVDAGANDENAPVAVAVRSPQPAAMVANAIFEDDVGVAAISAGEPVATAVQATPRKPSAIAVASKRSNAEAPRTPLGCLGNRAGVRQPLQMGKQQQHESKIPVMKSQINANGNATVWNM